MKKLLALLLVLIMLLSFTACSSDPNAGVYNAISCEAMGSSMDCDGEWLELKGNGKGKLCLMGEKYNCSWTLEGEKITVTNQGDEFYGTLHNGLITIDLGGLNYVYRMDSVIEKDGTVRGHVHVWKDVNCENGKTCTDCGATDGNPMSHDATQANYQDPSVCQRCGIMLGETLQPAMEKYGITEFMELGVIYPYTTVTYHNETLTTTGELVIDSYEIVDHAEGFPAKECYEWRIIKGRFLYFDLNARGHGYAGGYCYEDYYDIDLYDDFYEYDEETEITTRMISYHGQQMPCYMKQIWETSDWQYNYEKGRKESIGSFTRAWQVPIGYDGIVAGFYNKYSVEWNDRHIYEIYDPAQFLLFRLVNKEPEAPAAAKDSAVTGTYSLYAMDDAGEYINNETLVLLEMDGALVITFNEDGTGIMRMGEEALAFTYDDTKIVDAEGSTYEYALAEGMLEIYFGENQIFYCQKVES